MSSVSEIILSNFDQENQTKRITRRLIVGLGNPGKKYQDTRHNIGNMVVSSFVNDYLGTIKQISWIDDKKIPGFKYICNLKFSDHSTLDLTDSHSKRRARKTIEEGCLYPELQLHTLLPSTYMNCSGNAVRTYLNQDKFHLKNNAIAKNQRDELLIVTDDLDLPFGTCRFKPKGGSGGQNGIANIIKCTNTSKFARLRIGIGNNISKTQDSATFVLSKFNSFEQDQLPYLRTYTTELLRVFLHRGFTEAASIANSMTLQDYLKKKQTFLKRKYEEHSIKSISMKKR